ncbi:hypothetical protein K503DRAFT_870477 [Rhizopogon vinicolor AM-OR11-026]|uniref:Uncharacterized protein n=1 Tax=Rhizopogon vinicolor AM-OR11-026 TaxID=1314800 RepID=A0A1B7MGT1_9AGAM|nr:hypothetical protein K503DRAFT_870477 [Rhizopogon vinicolor AM-OR11-026]
MAAAFIPEFHRAQELKMTQHGVHSRVPSRTGRVPSDIREEHDDGRPPSEMVHVPPPMAPHSPHAASHVHFDPTAGAEFDDALHQRHERLDDAERELTQIVHDAHDAENRREDEFRHNEDAREQIFLQNEDRRDVEARQRGDALFAQLEERAQSVPPLPVPPPGPGDNVSIMESIHTASQEAASRYASDIMTTVQLEREQFERERESLTAERERERAELYAEHARMDEERAQRIHELEEELARVRGDLDNERQLRQTENEERMAANERDEGMRAQLGDITQLVSEQRDECARKKELMDQRWEEKEGRRVEKDAQFRELKDMVSRLLQDREADRIQEEERRLQEEGKPDIQAVLDHLNQQNAEMREMLDILSENWRNDDERRHQETLEAVRATAREQVPFNIQNYLDEFSKALATEVRMLLGEVGKLREERRNIQHELGYLMMMKAKYGPGGEFDPEWKPAMPGPGGPDVPPPPEPPAPPPEEHMPSRPAWRTVPRGTRRIRKPRPDQPPPPEPAPEPTRQPMHSWITWQPNPALAPTPPSIEPTLLVPTGSPGLFGPRSPRGSFQRGVKYANFRRDADEADNHISTINFFVNRKPPMPDPTSGPDMPPPPDPPALPSEEHMPARPAWRTVQRSTRRIHRPRPDQPPPPEPAPEPTRQPLHSWISWQPSPALAPTPPSIEPILLVAGRSPGLFGPRLPLEPDVPLPPDPSAPPSEGTYDSLLHSWITSQSNLALVPTPPSIEPILLVPGGSPGLFGPRSPREPYAPLPPDPSSPPLEEYMPARPVWRTVPRGTRRIRKPRPDQPPPPEPAPEPTRQPMHSWITWQPNPALAPTPPSIEPILLVPGGSPGGSPGLFGPRSPREPDVPPPPDPSSPPLEEHMPSQSNPALAPTPPSIEPILLVAGGSPGLFGPRSPLEPDVPPPLDPLALPPEEHMPARPVWRNPRSTRRVRNPRPDQPPHLEPAPEPTGQSSDSWITWQPNPALAPTPPSPLSPCNSLRVLSPNND